MQKDINFVVKTYKKYLYHSKMYKYCENECFVTLVHRDDHNGIPFIRHL